LRNDRLGISDRCTDNLLFTELSESAPMEGMKPKPVNAQSGSSAGTKGSCDGDLSLIGRLTPLAREVNCLDLERIARVCVQKVPELVRVRLASLYILDETTEMLYLQRCNHPFLINKIVSLNQKPPSPMVMAVTSKRMIFVSDIDRHKRPVIRKSQRAFARNYLTKNCMIAPLVCQDRVVGVLNLADKIGDEKFTPADIALVELFSQLVGASVGNIKLFEKMQRQATTDGLTGLVNHRTFYEILEKELWRSQRYGGQISLVMIDVDNLKKINDVYGHRAGDKAIKQVSRKIKECVRQVDTAARYGGDEFAVILPNTSLPEATVVAERMVEAVATSPVRWEGQEIPLSVSIGLGQYDADTKPEDITSHSDDALYAAKQAGKNTVRIFEHSKKNAGI